jgi:hypothetical protein
MSVYPQQVRDWISRRGGLSPQLIYLTGDELASMYPRCNESSTAAADLRPGHARGGIHPNKAQGATVSAAARIR